MHSWMSHGMKLSAAGLGLLAATAALAAPTYRIESVAKANGAAPKSVDAISDNGNYTGTGVDRVTGQQLKFVSRKGRKIEVLAQTNGPTFGGNADVNNAGTVVGRYLNGTGGERGGMWLSDGSLTDLGELVGCADPAGAYPRAINKAGDIGLQVDCDIDGVAVRGGVLLRGGVRTILPTLEGGPTYANAMNGLGQFTGSSEVRLDNGDTVQQAFIWKEGEGIRPLGRRGLESYGYAINDKGHVIGMKGTIPNWQPFLYKGAGLLDLPKCPDDRSFWPVAIANDDSIVGRIQWSGLPAQTGLIQNGECQLLQSLLDESGAGWTDLVAEDMNNQGVIVGSGRYQGFARSFIAKPIVADQR
jgi:uncharacterized membrane protein